MTAMQAIAKEIIQANQSMEAARERAAKGNNVTRRAWEAFALRMNNEIWGMKKALACMGLMFVFTDTEGKQGKIVAKED